MNYIPLLAIIIAINTANAEDAPPFSDRGSTYHPLQYVRTIATAEGAFTIEFKNEEESYFTNFIVTSDGVVAFDPLSDSAAVRYAHVIRERAPGKPLLAIVYSHLHTDHIAGARVLRHYFGQVPIIAHKRVLRFFLDRDTDFIDLPTETVSDEGQVYGFGNSTIDLRYLGDAHTGSILVAVVPHLRLAYVCDYANNDVVGWRDLPGIDIGEMIKMQRRTLTLDVDTVTFCHGPPGTLKAVERQIEYFEAVLAEAKKALNRGLTEDQAADSIDLPQYSHFSNYDDWFEGNVRAMYRWALSKQDN